MKKKNIGIIGFGNFGQFLYHHLKPHFSVFVYDKKYKKDELNQVLQTDILLLAVPVSSLDSVLKKIRSKLSPHTLVIDVASVKVKPIQLMKKYLSDNPLLGMHPLFGPESGKKGIEGLTIIYSPVRIDAKDLQYIQSFLKKTYKLNLTEMLPEDHDKQMAYVQGITHLIGKALNEMELPDFKEKTKAYSKLLDIKQLLNRTTFDLFKTIELENPYAKKIRRKFLAQLKKLENQLRR